MNPREIAEALEKNYHTTRSLLRKMEDAGEVRRSDGRYLAACTDAVHSQWLPSTAIDQKEQLEQQQPTCREAIDYIDYTDYADDRSHHSSTEVCNLSESAIVHEASELFSVGEDVIEIQQEPNKSELTVINIISRHYRWKFALQTLTRQILLDEKNTQMPFYKQIFVLIIRERTWCVLILPVKHGATS